MNHLFAVRLDRASFRERIRMVRNVNDLFQLIHYWGRSLRPPFWIHSRSKGGLAGFELGPAALPTDTRVSMLSEDGKIGHQIDIEDFIFDALKNQDEAVIRQINDELVRAALEGHRK